MISELLNNSPGGRTSEIQRILEKRGFRVRCLPQQTASDTQTATYLLIAGGTEGHYLEVSVTQSKPDGEAVAESWYATIRQQLDASPGFSVKLFNSQVDQLLMHQYPAIDRQLRALIMDNIADTAGARH